MSDSVCHCPYCGTQLPAEPVGSVLDPISEALLLVVGLVLFNVIEGTLTTLGLPWWLAFVVTASPFFAAAVLLRWARRRVRCPGCRAMVRYSDARVAGNVRSSAPR